MTRIAAVADIHFGIDSGGTYAPFWEKLHEHADLFLLAGDLTRLGRVEEAEVLAAELTKVAVPVIAVLGNHDFHADQEAELIRALERSRPSIRVLEGESTVVEIGSTRVGIAGTKGFGGGFVGACAMEFGERETKSFIRHTRELAERLESSLRSLDADLRVALLHYAPIEGTVEGEKRQIYPFLGSYLLAEAIDRGGADLAFHGHAHLGREKGVTPGGVPVRNVAQPVIRRAYNVYTVDARSGRGAELLRNTSES